MSNTGNSPEELQNALAEYEREMRLYETIATKWVKTFYIATRNRVLKSLVPKLQNHYSLKKFGSFVGGDMKKSHSLINSGYRMARIVETCLPFKTERLT